MIFKAGDVYFTQDATIKMMITGVEAGKNIYYHLKGEGMLLNSVQIITITRFQELIDMGEIKQC
jgi:hypothetical protein